jgi:hypothetical protein
MLSNGLIKKVWSKICSYYLKCTDRSPAAKKMEEEHVAKAEAEQAAHQEGTLSTQYSVVPL